MVLESLTTPQKAEKSPWDLIFIGAMYAAIGVFLSIWVFKEEASIVMVLLTVIATVPLVFNTMQYEESKDMVIARERTLLREHSKAIVFFTFMFVGFVFAFSFAYIFLPEDLVADIFDAQLSTIQNINSKVSGGSSLEGSSIGGTLFLQILTNNLKVLLFCLFFAFFYGAGAMFILIWNASVISAAIGTFFRDHISTYVSHIGFAKIAGYFHIFSLSLLRYFIHGIPEILGYFIGGLAGGIISVAVIRHDFGTPLFNRILIDSMYLIMLAMFVLVIAALIEVFITPLFF